MKKKKSKDFCTVLETSNIPPNEAATNQHTSSTEYFGLLNFSSSHQISRFLSSMLLSESVGVGVGVKKAEI